MYAKNAAFASGNSEPVKPAKPGGNNSPVPLTAGVPARFWHAGRVVVIARHRSVLARLGLDSIAGAKAFHGRLVKNHRGHRDIQVIDTEAEDGSPLRLFLKRNLKAYKKDGLLSLLRRGKCWSTSREEWENSLLLQKAGVPTAGLVAYGEECGPFWERFSYIVTEAAPGDCTLQDFLRECREPLDRSAVIQAFGWCVARMHAAGLASPDLFTRHVFVQAGPEPKFCLIDMARLDRHKELSPKQRARDLAALHVTAPLRDVSLGERLRFLLAYAGKGKGKVDRELVNLIRERANHLLRRRKFQDFSR